MVNVGVLGAGYWAQNMLRVIDGCENSELKMICDLDPAALSRAQANYRTARCVADAKEMFLAEEIDAVYLATPPQTHAKLAAAALDAGKHVLVEKPLATDAQDAGYLIERADIAQKVLMVGHTFLYSPPVRKIKQMVKAGEFGEVVYIDSARVNLGKHQPSGVIWDLAPHDVSIICHWLGEFPTHVRASGRCFDTSREVQDSPDVAFITLEFPSGVLAQIHLSWLAPAKLRRTTISGSKKMAIYDDTAGPEAIRIYDQGVEPSSPDTYGEFQLSYRRGDITIPFLEASEPLRVEWDHFVECVTSGSKPLTDGASGFQVVKVVEAVVASLRSGNREAITWTGTARPATRPTRPRFGITPSFRASTEDTATR